MADLERGDGYFSTPATSVEQAIELGVDEFPGDTEDDFTAVDCPECGMAGRARPRYRGDIRECEKCEHVRAGADGC
ncbi:hypothetical protein DMJ13_03465 [halophilic archaeon]|nr:hypothetical protein DMJ13_03465 [halophilic archaeon]